MSRQTICDGCGDEITEAHHQLSRGLLLNTGNQSQGWDLCATCQYRVAGAIAEALPHTPREVWFQRIVQPTQSA